MHSDSRLIPLPGSGERQDVAATVRTILDWEYALENQGLLSLYEKGKSRNWSANDLAWDTPVDVERLIDERVRSGGGFVLNEWMSPPRKLDEREAATLQLNINAYMLSQFLHGEQGALLAAARIVQTVPDLEAKFYAATQVTDEARHVEVYHRYLTEKLQLAYPVNASLQSLLGQIVGDSRWDVTYLGMQILVEGLALAAFGMQRVTMAGEPLIQDITSRIMADEARHVAFGVVSLRGFYGDGFSAPELREREDFVIEACHLLQARMRLDDVFERLGWEVKPWTEWAQNTHLMKGFQQSTFSNIVPNLKRLGLLTPRMRAAFEQMGILKYEHLPDSTMNPDPLAAPELARNLGRLLQDSLAKPD